MRYRLVVETNEPIDVMLSELDWINIQAVEDFENTNYPEEVDIEVQIISIVNL